MVAFGEHLNKEQTSTWAGNYVDYDLLKRKLKEVIQKQEANEPAVFKAFRNILQGLLDSQIEKVLSFYSAKVAEIETAVARSSENVQRILEEVTPASPTPPSQKLARVDEGILALRERALEITNLVSFVSLNMAAIRKILKKIAKNIQADGPHGPGLLTLRIEHPHEPGWKVLQGTYLPAKVGRDLEDMQRHQTLLDMGKQVKDMYEKLHLQHDLLRGNHPEVQHQQPKANPELERRISQRLESISSWKYAPPPLRSTRSRLSGDGNSQPGRDRADDAVRQMDALLEQMALAERLAQKQSNFVHVLTWEETQAGIWEKPPKEEDAIATFNGLLLNCVNSGLYMASYNVIIPTITALCDHIGVSDSAVGLIIGMCDIATIFGTVGYSIWTSTSYKAPLIASAVACLLGNVAYCLSFDMRSIWLLVLARLITGFGSARAVNRRYIAMYVARKDRTSASALFVSLSAVGMALGPLLALPLSHVTTRVMLGLTFGPITLGGWTMNVAWLAFIIWAALTFQDPLKVVAAREARARNGEDLEQPLLNGDEEKPLLPPGAPSMDLTDTADETVTQPESMASWAEWFSKSSVVPTTCAIFLCFILKVVQQAYIDGLPIFTIGEYKWSSGQCGIMLGVLGLVAPFINQTVGLFAARLSDRHITSGSIIVTGIGSVLMMKGAYPEWSFFTGGTLIYMGTIVLEAVSLSLTTKVIDDSMNDGLFNAGLLSTQAGTIGRFCGNLLLSLCASITGAANPEQISALAATLFGSTLSMMAFSLLFVLVIYRRLIC